MHSILVDETLHLCQATDCYTSSGITVLQSSASTSIYPHNSSIHCSGRIKLVEPWYLIKSTTMHVWLIKLSLLIEMHFISNFRKLATKYCRCIQCLISLTQTKQNNQNMCVYVYTVYIKLADWVKCALRHKVVLSLFDFYIFEMLLQNEFICSMHHLVIWRYQCDFEYWMYSVILCQLINSYRIFSSCYFNSYFIDKQSEQTWEHVKLIKMRKQTNPYNRGHRVVDCFLLNVNELWHFKNPP